MTADDRFATNSPAVDWQTVYDRQAARGALTPHFIDRLELESGDRVLELGCGPGYLTAQLAAHVTPGSVYAVDRRLDALRFLGRMLDRRADRVHPIGGDVTALPVEFRDPIPTIV